MSACEYLRNALKTGTYDRALRSFYAPDGEKAHVSAARTRVERLLQAWEGQFGSNEDVLLCSAPGRTEIGGNHTDHQHGKVLCGSVNLDILACAAPNHLQTVRIFSEGYPALELRLEELTPREEERGTSAALVRGVAARVAALGYPVTGFDACIQSNVLSGSGLSSSAAYEVLIGCLFNRFCCHDRLTPVEIAKAGQYAENVFFGKPCGLMDQMGSAVGGAIAIDFREPETPEVQTISFDFSRCGYALCIVDTGSSHQDLTSDYADITQEMGRVAAFFGKTVLRDVEETAFFTEIPALRRRCGDRAVLRAMHFFAEDRRVEAETQALRDGNFPRFLELVNESGLSSSLCLQNTWSVATPRNQAVPLALEIGRTALAGDGAIRVHGGGFAGTIQAFVPEDRLTSFRNAIEALTGAGTCHTLWIREKGGCLINQDEWEKEV